MLRKFLKIASSSAILSILVVSPAFAQSTTVQESAQGSVTVGSGNITGQSVDQNTFNSDSGWFGYDGPNVQTQSATQGSGTVGNFNATIQETDQNSTNIDHNYYPYPIYYGY